MIINAGCKVTLSKIVFSILGGFMGWFFGEYDSFLYILVTFIVIDYISGVLLSIKEKKLSSEIGFSGIIKKISIFILIGMGNVLDSYLIKNGDILRTVIIFFYISNEGISILENISNIGLPIPKKLKSILEQIKK